MLISDSAVAASPHMNPEAAHVNQRRLMALAQRRHAQDMAINAQQNLRTAHLQNKALQRRTDPNLAAKIAAMNARRQKVTNPKAMQGLGDSSSTSTVVIGALLGGLLGYALTRKGSGAMIGAMLAPPVMYAVPVYARPSFGFWF